MPAATASLNSTNVRNAVRFGWHRLAIAVGTVLAPERAVDTAARLFTSPPRHAHTARELEFLATGTGFEVASVYGRLAAWRFGAADRPAVLFSHGWGGRGAQLRSFVPALVEAGYQVVLFDHTAHGSSTGREATIVHFVKGSRRLPPTWKPGRARRGPGRPFARRGGGGGWLNQTQRKARVALIAPPTSLERYSTFFARRLGIAEPIRRAMQELFERKHGLRWSEFELPQSVARIRAEALVIHDASDDEVRSRAGSPSRAPGRARASFAPRASAIAPSCAMPAWSATWPISSPIAWCSRRLRSAATGRPSPRPHPFFEEPTMRKHLPQEHSARVLAIALATWGAGVVGAASQGVFAKISATELAGLAMFATAYALATFLLDATLRRFVLDTAGRHIAPAAIAADAVIAAAVLAILGGEGAWQPNVAQPAYAFVLLYVAPLAAVLHLAWLERASRRSPARSPGASPAST